MPKWIAFIGIFMVCLFQSACGGNSASSQTASRPPACPSRQPAFLFPGPGAIWPGEAAVWQSLSLFHVRRSEETAVLRHELVEAVVPTVSGWFVTDLDVGARGAQQIAAASKAGPGGPEGTAALSAEVCRMGARPAVLSNLRVMTGAGAMKAIQRTQGIALVAPSVVRPGGTLFVVLDRGSYEDAVFQGGFNGVVDWYALGSNGVGLYRTPILDHTTADNQALFAFGMPAGMAPGTYSLVLLTPQRARARGMGFLNGASGADFIFSVR